MGIHINLAILLRDWLERHQVHGPVLTLGVQDTPFTWEQLNLATGKAPEAGSYSGAVNAKSLFGAFGLSPVTALDVSDYEGAESIFDLNEAELPLALKGSAGLVFNGGTLEHVFNVATAIGNITRMVRESGFVMHVMPCNNWVNHGFYQFSPTFIFDYYRAQGLPVVEAALVSFDPKGNADIWRVRQVSSGLGALTGVNALDGRAYLLCALVRVDVDRPPIAPTQAYYAPDAVRTHPTRWFPLFDLNAGSRVDYPNRKIIPLRQITRQEGRMWVASVPELEFLADGMDSPRRSQAILLEDAVALGPGHALHSDIAATGWGAYSHWGASLLFSTSDGSAPDTNGREYTLVIPHPEHA